jgi:hypothetical protein
VADLHKGARLEETQHAQAMAGLQEQLCAAQRRLEALQEDLSAGVCEREELEARLLAVHRSLQVLSPDLVSGNHLFRTYTNLCGRQGSFHVSEAFVSDPEQPCSCSCSQIPGDDTYQVDDLDSRWVERQHSTSLWMPTEGFLTPSMSWHCNAFAEQCRHSYLAGDTPSAGEEQQTVLCERAPHGPLPRAGLTLWMGCRPRCKPHAAPETKPQTGETCQAAHF